MIKVGDILKSKNGGSLVKIVFILEGTIIGNIYSVYYQDNSEICWFSQNEMEDIFDFPKEKWRPEAYEEYWFVCSDGSLVCCVYSGEKLDQDKEKFGNCFQTKAEAEVARDKIREVLKGE